MLRVLPNPHVQRDGDYSDGWNAALARVQKMLERWPNKDHQLITDLMNKVSELRR